MDRKHYLNDRRVYGLNFDSSPQCRGTEIMATVEDAIKWAAIYNKSFDQIEPSDIVTRPTSIATLSQGRCGLIDKGAALTHQRWLVKGPTREAVVAANIDTLTSVADMGTEIKIGDLFDVSDAVINKQELPSDLMKQAS